MIILSGFLCIVQYNVDLKYKSKPKKAVQGPLKQWFLAFGRLQNSDFGDPKVSARNPNMGHDEPVEKHCS